MVISEAMAARVPVVVSDVCGAAAQIASEAGSIVPLDASIESWADAVDRQLGRIAAPPQFARGWGEVAREYEIIYREIFEAALND
jgi:UDP-glucose:(heptosyl)LPS alpha-1,3-glucosyltransferase